VTAHAASMPLGQTSTAASMFVRELLRRWPTVAFMIFLPLSYFIVSYVTTLSSDRMPLEVLAEGGRVTVDVLDRDVRALYLAVLGISVTSSFAALTTVLGSTAVMRRLRLTGFRSGALLNARLAVLALITVVSTAVFLAVFVPLVDVRSVVLTAAALLLVGLIGVTLGTVVGLLVPREFEAAMIIISVAGIQMALGRGNSSAERYLVYWPAVEALKTGVFAPSGWATGPLLLGIAYVVVLLALASSVWGLRTRVRGPSTDAPAMPQRAGREGLR
jgi:hypothetical protein